MKNIQPFDEFNAVNEAALSPNMVSNFNQIKQAVNKANKLLGLPESKKVDKVFMIEIAMAETKLGTDNGTVRTEGNAGRGAWQLDKIGFDETKNTGAHPQVQTYIDRLKKHGIDWMKLDWNKCNNLLYGAIAARIILLNKPFSIGKTVEERAKQWKQHYNSGAGAGSAGEYIERVDTCKETLGIHEIQTGITVPKTHPTGNGHGMMNFVNFKGRKRLVKE